MRCTPAPTIAGSRRRCASRTGAWVPCAPSCASHRRRRSASRTRRCRSASSRVRPPEPGNDAVKLDDTPADLESTRRAGDVILSVEGISLAFGGVKALTDVTFDVREHEVRAIIGPNGAGKRSLLNVVHGVYRPQSGPTTFLGDTYAAMDAH